MSQNNISKNLVYIATKYPLLSETFIYEEIIALKKLGYRVRFFVLYSTGRSSHQFTDELVDSVFYLPQNLSVSAMVSHFFFLISNPKQYSETLFTIIRDTFLTPRVMLKSLYAFNKGVILANILRKDLPDHIHSHWATMPTTVAFVASQLDKISYSFTSHAWDIYKEPAMFSTKLEHAAFHTTISQYNRKYIQNLYHQSSDKIIVSRCGVSLERFPFRKKYPINKPIEILFVGRLVEKKGTLILVEACACLRDMGCEFICTIVGDGPQRKQVEYAIEMHQLQGVVKLTGELPQEQLHRYWENASMFVLPCAIEQDGNRDGIPVVLMEAMALGIPVISTKISGIPELVEDGVTGVLSANDALSLCEAMSKLIDNIDFTQDLIANARLKVEREYNIKINAQKKADIFQLHFNGKGKFYG